MKKYFTHLFVSVGILLVSLTAYAQPSWVRVDYTQTMAFVGEVGINTFDAGFPATVVAGDYVGAFVGAECRMSAEVFAYNGKLYVSAVIHGGDLFGTSTPELIEFKVWDKSANAVINSTVKGTLASNPGGEKLDYVIGKPNTVSELNTLSITGVTLVPAFSKTVTSYAVTMPSAAALPAITDYVTTLVDSRSTVLVEPAIDYATNKTTKITVTAEDGTKTVYNIVFTETACTTTAPIVVSSVKYCKSATATALTATGTALKWYDGATLLASAPTPSTITTGTKTYSVSQTVGCEGPKADIIVTVNDLPTYTITGGNAVCEGETPTLVQATFTGVAPFSYQYKIDAGAPVSGTATTAGVGVDLAATEGVYSIVSVSDANCAGILSPTQTATIIIYPLPTVSISATPTTVGKNGTVALTLVPATGGILSGSTGVSGLTFNPALSAVGAQTLSYEYTDANTCTNSATTVVTVVDNADPVLATTNVVYEKGTTVTPISVTAAGTVTWYDSNNQIIVGAGNPFTPSIDINTIATYEYYVSNTVSGIESNKVKVTVKVSNCAASAPVVISPVKYCKGATATALTATGTALKWYDAALAALPAAPVPSTTTVGSVSYFVTQTVGCESETAEIVVTINDLPTVSITANPTTVGKTGTVALTLVPVAGGTLSGSTGVSGLTFNPALSATGAQTLQYEYTDANTCKNTATTIVTVVDNAEPTVPNTSISIVKGGSVSPIQVTATGTVTWYDSNNQIIVGAGNPFTPTIDTDVEGVTEYYVSNTVGGLESNKVKVTITVSACATAAPTVTSSVKYCKGATATALSATGTALQWYNSAQAPLASAPVPSTTTVGSVSYFVSQTIGCEGAKAEIVVTVNDLPTVSISATPTTVGKNGTVALTLVPATGGTLSGSTGVSGLTFNPATSAVGAQTLQYEYTDANTCKTSATTVVTVINNTVPTVPNTSITIVKGATVTPIQVTASGTVKWYDSNNQLIVGAGNPYTPAINTNTEAVYEYFVSNTVSGIESDKVKVTVNVIACATAAPIVTSPVQYCKGATATALTATGTSLKWYDASQSALPSAPVPSTTTVGNVSYFVSQTVGCEGAKAEIIVTVNALPATPIAGANSPVTINGVINLTASVVTGANYEWTGPMSYTSMQQNPVIQNVTATMEGTYSVVAIVNNCKSIPNSVSVVVKSDFTALSDKIVEANQLISDNYVNQGTGYQQIPPASFTILEAAIADAQSVVSTGTATQTAIDALVASLDQAMDDFLNSKVTVVVLQSLSVLEPNVILNMGDTYIPDVIIAPAGATANIQWQSYNTAVAEVDDVTGLITAKNKGIVLIKGVDMANPTISVDIVVRVQTVPKILSISTYESSKNVTIEFSEAMVTPTLDMYGDFEVKNIVTNQVYTISSISLDGTLNSKKLVITTAESILDPSKVTVSYVGVNLQSTAGGKVKPFSLGANTTVSVENLEASNIFVYPTVAVNNITIEGVETGDILRVVTQSGQVLLVTEASYSQTTIDVSGITSGKYIVLITRDNELVQSAFFIKK